MELDAIQMFLIGLAASGVAGAIRWAIAKWGENVISRRWATAIVYVLSVVLAAIFNIDELPVFVDDFAGNVQAVVAYITALFGWATLVYNVFLAAFFEKIGWDPEGLASRFITIKEIGGGSGLRG